MHNYECTNKGTQTQEKNKTYYNTRYKRKVIIIILKKKQDYILLLFALFI